jgi:hypothetical protein
MLIAFDTSVDAGNVTGTTLTWNHTITGPEPAITVSICGNTTTDLLTGVTCGGIAMTLVAKVDPTAGGASRWTYQFLLLNPAQGVNAIVATSSSSSFMAGQSSSYINVRQSAQPSAFATNVLAAGGTFTTTVTPVDDNCWVIANMKNSAGSTFAAAGAATTIRRAATTGGLTTCDSNGPVTPAAARTLTLTHTSTSWSGVICALAPSLGNAGAMFNAM